MVWMEGLDKPGGINIDFKGELESVLSAESSTREVP